MHSHPPSVTARRRSAWHLPLLALLLGLAQPLWAAPVTLNLKDADIGALIASISEITGKNFIVDPRVKARVSVISARPMEADEIYQVFLSILAVHGFAAVPGDNVIKIVPAPNAKQEAIPTVQAGLDPGGPDQVITRVIQMKNVSAAQIVPILRPLIPPEGHLAAYAPTNVLIVSDLAANVERIANIIARVDQASGEEVEVVQLRHASAADVVRVLNSLEQSRAQGDATAAAGGAPGAAPRLVADERTNSVLMSGDRSARLRLRTLIAHLDTPLPSGGNTQVVYLRYAKAKDMVPILQGVSQSLNKTPGAAPAPTPGASGGQAAIANIQADEATNSVVITAEPNTLQALKSVIAQLDVRRAQVLVEAVIAEISTDRAAELGVQWVIDGRNDGSVVGLSNFNNGSLSVGTIGRALTSDQAVPELPAIAGAVVGDFTGSIRFGALITALGSDAGTNVLSTPSLVTLDNEEAKIIVGQNVPFVTGSFTTSVGGTTNGTTGLVGNPFQTIERQDVGLTLKIKPQINEGNAIRLDIEQEVSNVVPTATAAIQGPTTNKRALKTSVLVEDGQILVLGGLVDDNLSESLQKVPGLGDIPLIGELFRSRKTSKTKRNLMVFLHPVILRDASQGTLSTNDKYSYIREQQFLARQRGVSLMPDAQTPVLPPPEQVRREGTILDITGQSGAAPTPSAPAAPPAPQPGAAAQPPPTQPPAAPNRARTRDLDRR
ncbi:MAG TPA: type II secretion system secretin GspD [Candidatus Competibacteraceae bacterium]|nr:type II secretion system secretin GspD [Candidatus Competibacteraceae bacterium]